MALIPRHLRSAANGRQDQVPDQPLKPQQRQAARQPAKQPAKPVRKAAAVNRPVLKLRFISVYQCVVTLPLTVKRVVIPTVVYGPFPRINGLPVTPAAEVLCFALMPFASAADRFY